MSPAPLLIDCLNDNLCEIDGSFLGSGPDRGRSPVECPSVRLFVRLSPPLGHPARSEAQPARPEAQPARLEAQPAKPEA